jgi:molecular chaperone GrpE
MKRKSTNVKKSQAKKDSSKKMEDKMKAGSPEMEDESIDGKKELAEISEEKLKAEEIDFQATIDELNDKYLRLYSEFDNYRKRTIKERLELSKNASEEIISELLPVVDDFERAIKSSEGIEDCDALKEGMNLIYSKLSSTLNKKGLTCIEAIGQEFNTDYHEAITYITAPSPELKGKIVDEVVKGYMLNDKVIRYSKVVIGQ